MTQSLRESPLPTKMTSSLLTLPRTSFQIRAHSEVLGGCVLRRTKNAHHRRYWVKTTAEAWEVLWCEKPQQLHTQVAMAFWNWGQDLTGRNSGHWVSLVRLGSWDPLTDTPADSGLPRVAASFPRGALLSFFFSLSTCLVHCDLSTGPHGVLEGLQLTHGRLGLPPGWGLGLWMEQ